MGYVGSNPTGATRILFYHGNKEYSCYYQKKLKNGIIVIINH